MNCGVVRVVFKSGINGNDTVWEVTPAEGKLSGHAVQNQSLLRMLPVLIVEKKINLQVKINLGNWDYI